MSTNNDIVTVKNLRMYFPVRKGIIPKIMWVKAVDDVSLSVKTGEALAIVGESGCGKTTLGKTILRIYEPLGGTIRFEGRDITHLKEDKLKWFRRKAQLIYQDPFESQDPYYTIYGMLDEILRAHKLGDKREREERIYSILEKVKLKPPEYFAMKYPHMLSGGQRQRIAIARALILEPILLIADEPVSMVDVSLRAELLYLLQELQGSEKAYIYITHDLSTAKYFCNKIAVMYGGKIMEKGIMRRVLEKPSHPYTSALIETIPDINKNVRTQFKKVPVGEPPNLMNPPPGCRFYDRCEQRMDICKNKVPSLVELDHNHKVACFLYN